uniref:Methyltransferase n=1 Tax=viral metagenome TaxID=1070528 RepID=A0A6C0CHG5_9ZZZZ
MWFDKLALGQQQQVSQRLTDFTNPEKDPDQTKMFLDATLKYASVFTKDGEYRRLTSHTRQAEHDEIRKRLLETHAKNTLEVGLAYGTSALVFAEYHQRAKSTGVCHTAIDPNQFGNGEGHWEGIGVQNLKRVGFIKGRNWRLVEKSSVDALPDLARKLKVDVALIDGYHLFDYTLMDVFYCLKMLRVGGVLIVDDKKMRAIKAVAQYVMRSYKNVAEICPDCQTLLVIRKVREDDRDWKADEMVNFNLN